MTRLTRKDSSLLLAIFILIIILIGMAGCGPAYHLRRAEHHIDKAIEKGAEIKKDTITFHFKSPEIKFRTTITPSWLDGAPIPLWRDTLTAKDKKTGATVKAKIALKKGCPEDCIDTVYLEMNVPPQNQTVDVPCDTVQAGYTRWDMIVLALAMIPGGWLIMTFVVVPLVRKVRR